MKNISYRKRVNHGVEDKNCDINERVKNTKIIKRKWKVPANDPEELLVWFGVEVIGEVAWTGDVPLDLAWFGLRLWVEEGEWCSTPSTGRRTIRKCQIEEKEPIIGRSSSFCLQGREPMVYHRAIKNNLRDFWR